MSKIDTVKEILEPVLRERAMSFASRVDQIETLTQEMTLSLAERIDQLYSAPPPAETPERAVLRDEEIEEAIKLEFGENAKFTPNLKMLDMEDDMVYLPDVFRHVALSQHALDAGRIEALEKKLADSKNELLARYREQIKETWYWQGDGEDHLESTTCPILIEAEDLRQLIAGLEAKATKYHQLAHEWRQKHWNLQADRIQLYETFNSTLNDIENLKQDNAKLSADHAQAMKHLRAVFESARSYITQPSVKLELTALWNEIESKHLNGG